MSDKKRFKRQELLGAGRGRQKNEDDEKKSDESEEEQQSKQQEPQKETNEATVTPSTPTAPENSNKEESSKPLTTPDSPKEEEEDEEEDLSSLSVGGSAEPKKKKKRQKLLGVERRSTIKQSEQSQASNAPVQASIAPVQTPSAPPSTPVQEETPPSDPLEAKYFKASPEQLEAALKELQTKKQDLDNQLNEQKTRKQQAIQADDFDTAIDAKAQIQTLSTQKTEIETEEQLVLKKIESSKPAPAPVVEEKPAKQETQTPPVQEQQQQQEPQKMSNSFLQNISIPQQSKRLDYKSIAENMKKAGSIDWKEKKVGKNNERSFLGSDATTWLGNSMGMSNEEAKKVGQALMASGLIACVTQGQPLFSEKEYYYFQNQEEFFKNRKPNVKVQIIEATLIPREVKDAEPYCIVRFGKNEKKTKSAKSIIAPQWNEEFKIPVELGLISSTKLEILIQDKNTAKKNQFLGQVSLDVGALVAEEEQVFRNYTLEGAKDSNITFSVTACEFGHPDSQSAASFHILRLNPAVDNFQIIQKLVNQGADTNGCNSNGETPLHLYCTKESSPAALELLVDNGANLSRKDHRGRTPLHVAVLNVAPKQAQALIKKGAPVDALDDDGKAPLHLAANHKISSLGERHPCLMVLLEGKANANIADSNGDTPLHLAARIPNKHTAQALLENGGKPSCQMKNKKDKIPIQEGLFDQLKPFTF